MSTCTILTKKTNITPERNCIVDNIATYLSSLTTIYLNQNFQYQKITLDKTIKLDVSQTAVAYNSDVGNYLIITQDNKTYYYFILSATWKAEHTVELECSLDTLNTFATSLTFNKKTNVIREHRNRWRDSSTALSAGTTYTKNMIVDPMDEGISGVATQVTKHKIQDSVTKLGDKWYLVYRTKDNIGIGTYQPVECMLLPTKTTLKTTITTGTITADNLSDGTFYYCIYSPSLNQNIGVTVAGRTINDGAYLGIVFYKSGSKIKYDFLTKTTNTHDLYYNIMDDENDPQEVTSLTFGGNNSATIRYTYYTAGDPVYCNIIGQVILSYPIAFTLGSTANISIADITRLDRTDPCLIKIIECPYCPIEMTIDSSNIITLPSGWTVRGGAIICSNPSVELERSIYNYNLAALYNVNFTTDSSNVAHTLRNDNLEPKIRHSSISTYKLLYDSFSNELKAERIVPSNDETIPTLALTYKQSNTINSNLAFKWSLSNGFLTEYSDYDQFLIASRNNESTIYTSNYLDYLKTGYNYDKKSKTRTDLANWIGTGISIVGATLSAAAGGPVAAATAITLGVNTISSLTNAIKTSAENESTLQQKLLELQQQAISVSVADDIDLLNFYSDNKLYINSYTPTDEVKSKIYDLFYYCGYATNKQKIPTVNSRYWFNYLQCDAVFDVDSNNNVYEQFIDDIKARFSIGVTYYHDHSGEYDWAQQYENWESGLVA